MNTTNDSILRKRFLSQATDLRNAFAAIRDEIKDSDVKGSRNEEIISRLLRINFSSKPIVTNSLIFDSFGKTSDEIDVAICNEYQPFFSEEDSRRKLISEGVDIAVQVKAVLNTDELRRIIKNCRTVKRLRRISNQGDRLFFQKEDLPYYVDRVPYIAFAFESSLIQKTALKNFRTELQNVPLEEQPDAIFVLNHFTLLNFRQGTHSAPTSRSGKKMTGVVAIETGEFTLFEFIKFILLRSPKIYRFNHPFTNYFGEQNLYNFLDIENED